MKRLNHIIMLIAILAIGLSSCKIGLLSYKKDNDDEKTNREQLTSGAWSIKAATSSPPLSGATDLYAEMKACYKDNTFSYNTSGVLVSDEGATKCDDAKPQQRNGTWTLDADNVTLTTIIEGDTTVGTITSISDNSMVVQVDIGFLFTFTFGRE